MLAEVDGSLIIGLIILAPLILWLLGWVFALVVGTGRAVRHHSTKNPETKREIEQKIERGLRERGLVNDPHPPGAGW